MNVLGLASTVKETVGIFSAEDARKRKVRAPSTFSKDKPQTRERRRSKRVAGEEAPSLNMDAVEGREPERQEEVYGVEHVRALGACTKPWDLFVDGYDPKGNRIYDKSAGLTCHQCRQKTLGKRTACSLCNSLQGLFCGDCLFMRYGENIDEVKQNSSWICPPCRDLCNCSFHRSRKGWCPTGMQLVACFVPIHAIVLMPTVFPCRIHVSKSDSRRICFSRPLLGP